MINRREIATGLKRCSMCRLDRTLDHFYVMKKGFNVGRYSQHCKACTVNRGRAWQQANLDKRCASAVRSARKRRVEVLSHYAQGTPQCACCGETQMEFLSLDHVNNDGAAHRRLVLGSARNSSGMYGWVKKHGFPQGFQVLCMNCNWAKGKYGGCPHLKEVYMADAEHF